MELMVLDSNLNFIAPIDNYDSCIWSDRYYEGGDFELVLPIGTELASTLAPDMFLMNRDSEHVMIIEKQTLSVDAEDGEEYIVTGRSLETILDRRIIWKQTTLSGNFQNAIKKLLDENALCDGARKIPNLIFEESTDEAITDLEMNETQFTGDNLYTVISSLCASAGIGFGITLGTNKQLVFKLYSGVDRSSSQDTNSFVIFSPEFDNLLSSSYVYNKASYKNVALVGGEGEGNDRRYMSIGEAEGFDRRELFVDARDISMDTGESDSKGNAIQYSTSQYNTMLQSRGEEQLAEYPETSSFTGKIENNVVYSYRVDYNLGDIVEIKNEYGMSKTARITEMVMSEDKNGYTIYPTFES